MRLGGAAALTAAAVVAASALAVAQRPQAPQPGSPQMPPFRGMGRMGGEAANLAPGQVPYDGRFTFARLRFSETANVLGFGGGRFGGRGRGQGPPWSHDYPRAERNFMKILDQITTIGPYTGDAGGTIVDIGSPDLFNYPLAYMAEAGFWTQTDAEAANLRAYLAKGGFIIFDDYRGNDWANFETQMRRVLPDIRFQELDVSHPIFHSFFDITTLEFKQFYDRDKPYFMGAFENNDPSKRLLLIANYNNDVGEFWEFSDTGWVAIDLSNEAYKLGVNYIVYGMTH